VSKTPSEFLDNVLAIIGDDDMRKLVKGIAGEEDATFAVASMIVERVVRELDGKAESIACLEMVKFKILIGDLPERWWPKTDVQKGGE